jgi:N-acetylmuramoyl-L-alanine amidase
MSAEIKNDKHYTNNINIIKLFFIVLILLIISGSAHVPEKSNGWIIVIDPGHGGKDPGALGAFSQEKSINMAIALKTGEYLEQNIKNVKVIYTRKSDSDVDLWARADIANKNKADLFISVHANLSKIKNVYGAETWVMGHHKDQQNLEVAMKENEVILLENDYSTKYEGFDPKSSESYIMFFSMQNIYLEQSTDLASRIQSELKESAGRYDRGVKQAGFVVLFMTTMPSVLVETGFISNPAEEKYINSKQGQDNIASSIYRACKDYIGEINKKSGIKVDKPIVTPDTVTIKSDNKNKVIFMVQVATSPKKIEIKPGNFKNLKDIVELNAGTRFKYATGNFTEYAKAVDYRKQLERIYPDAFVITVKDNKILPLHEALDKKKGK